MLVGDVRNDPRYLNTVDAVRTELAVPMTARGKLVGVIDLQSTRLNAYTEYDRALLRLIAARVGIAIDNARLYRRVERQNRTLKTLANISREFSSILDLNELLGKIASTMRELINYDAFSILLVDHEAKALRHRFSIRYDQRVNIDNVPLGKGITGAAAESREVVRVHDTTQGPALHRLAPRHPLGSGRAADRAGPRGGRDGPGERPRRLLHRRPRAHADAAGAAGGQQRGERAPVSRSWPRASAAWKRTCRPRANCSACCCRTPRRRSKAWMRPCGCARRARSRAISTTSSSTRDRQTVIAFGDVSGKGAAAALYGGLMSGLLRTLAPRRRRPAELLQALNDALIERKVEARYVTLCVLLWDPATRQIVMANAGALPPMICRGGEILKIRVEGVPLGLLDAREYEEVAFQAEPGDAIVLYSDGITDHLNAAGARITAAAAWRRWCAPTAAQPAGELIARDLRGPGQVLNHRFRRPDGVRHESEVRGATNTCTCMYN